MLTPRTNLLFLPMAIAALAAASLSGCGGGGSSGGVVTPVPTFIPDRTSPAPGELYLDGVAQDATTLLLNFEMLYPANWGYPYGMHVKLTMPLAALEPVSVTGCSTWPQFDGIIYPRAQLFPGPNAGEWYVSSDFTMYDIFSDDNWFGSNCSSPGTWPLLPADRRVRFATVTVKIKQAGSHAIALDGGGIAACVISGGTSFSPPSFGGVVTVP